MPFNASGVFQRLFNWRNDRDAGIKILAERMDQEMNGIVDGINTMVRGEFSFIGPVTGVFGTKDAPAYAFQGDADTGMFRLSGDTLGFSVGGDLGLTVSPDGVVIDGVTLDPGHQNRTDNPHEVTAEQTGAYTASETDAKISEAIDALVGGAPGALDTLQELATALQGNEAGTTDLVNQIATKLSASEYTAGDVLAKIKSVDGPASGLNADLLDGREAAQFIRSDANDFTTGRLDFNVQSGEQMRIGYGAGAGVYPYLSFFHGEPGRKGFIQSRLDGLRIANDGGAVIDLRGESDVNINGKRIWHSGNDGAGSGLNADLLDGRHASQFVQDLRLGAEVYTGVAPGSGPATIRAGLGRCVTGFRFSLESDGSHDIEGMTHRPIQKHVGGGVWVTVGIV